MLHDAVRYRAGSGVLLALGRCFAATGRFVEAHARYQEALEAAGKATKDRETKERMAREGLARVEGRIARIEVGLGAAAPAGTTITKDGEVVGAGSVVVANPGAVIFDVTAPGCEAARVEVMANPTRRESAGSFGIGRIRATAPHCPLRRRSE